MAIKIDDLIKQDKVELELGGTTYTMLINDESAKKLSEGGIALAKAGDMEIQDIHDYEELASSITKAFDGIKDKGIELLNSATDSDLGAVVYAINESTADLQVVIEQITNAIAIKQEDKRIKTKAAAKKYYNKNNAR